MCDANHTITQPTTYNLHYLPTHCDRYGSTCYANHMTTNVQTGVKRSQLSTAMFAPFLPTQLKDHNKCIPFTKTL